MKSQQNDLIKDKKGSRGKKEKPTVSNYISLGKGK